MTADQRDDPFRGYNFQISLLDSSASAAPALTTGIFSSANNRSVGGFSECSGLEMSLEVEDYMEGGNNGTVLKFPTRVKWEHITLKKGLTTSTELWDWFNGFVQARGLRKDGLITLKNEMQEPRVVWGFRRGLPLKYSGPSLNAGQSEVAIESIEIVHEGLFQMNSVVGEVSGTA